MTGENDVRGQAAGMGDAVESYEVYKAGLDDECSLNAIFSELIWRRSAAEMPFLAELLLRARAAKTRCLAELLLRISAVGMTCLDLFSGAALADKCCRNDLLRRASCSRVLQE